MHPSSAPAVRSLAIALTAVMTAVLISACQKRGDTQTSTDISRAAQINALITRLNQLEERVSKQLPSSDDSGERVPPGPIKSITFRSGTADDRLRIYWENGKVSSLPCTLEQGTWACG
ncbi:hypothetical protein SynBIOSU31_02897 [Synechococcus sp. BIOS-U3-1]|uniref:hypothetical protein n=1 Tax=Synechococcus sp. BIOS-U3-1 TaxID=1400865 RepID=UPI0016474796|nr:hypothetical protein [Synechococcus sp. BIOS-U3-1]QNI59753.1 hypothetical protein SynBIOSU31_02897 [Synechococcus sp. BIOS-U3-1]